MPLLLFQSFVINSQGTKKYTLEIFEDNISSELEKIFYLPDVNRNLQFVFVVKDNDNANKDNSQRSFITSLIRKTAEKNNVRYSISKDTVTLSNDSAFYVVKIGDIKLSTKYPRFKKNNFLGEKTIVRQIDGNISVEIESIDKKYSHNNNIVLHYTDEIDYDSYTAYESEYSFTKSIPPNVSTTESLIFPVLLVVFSAAATILFFAIRSK